VKALVTGGAGFIGSNLVRGLLDEGHDVRVLDNFSTGFRSNLEDLDIEIVEGELRSYERCHAAVRGIDVVFHLGALGSVPRSVQDPLTSSAVNVEGTLNVLLAARDTGVRRLVFASSSSVCGGRAALPAVETLPVDPISPYGVSKLAAERYCVSFSRVYAPFETVVLRYFNVFGPRQSPNSQYAAVIPLFVDGIANGRPIAIFGDGGQSRDFTYVANVVDATIRAGLAEGASGRVFNVAAGSPATVNDVADVIGAILGREVEREYAPARPGDIRDSFASIDAAREVLGFEPSVDLHTGLARTVEALVGASSR
jgi:UDP-glucose 4-epimerase